MKQYTRVTLDIRHSEMNILYLERNRTKYNTALIMIV